MEDMNRRLAAKLDETNRAHEEEMRQLRERFADLSNRLGAGEMVAGRNNGGAGATAPSGVEIPGADPDTPVPDYTESLIFPDSPAPGYSLSKTSDAKNVAVKGAFGPGFRFETEDEEFRLQVHLGSQLETRIWGQPGQIPANSGFFLPRQRIFFVGNITKPIEYEFSVNRGLDGTVNILNAFINLHFDDRFQFRFGRFFTPITYDQYTIPIYWMPTPERSLFTTNVSLGRQIGLMGWGYLFDKRLDYAAGVFNGSRNSFQSLNNGVDLAAFVNARPFQESEALKFARFLNVGTSVAFGYQDQAPVPAAFRLGAARTEWRRTRRGYDSVPDPQSRCG